MKKAVIWTMVLFLAGAVPVSAAPVMDCGMTAMTAAHAAPCCPPDSCGCKLRQAEGRSLLGALPASAPVLFLTASMFDGAASFFSAPIFRHAAPAPSPSPPPEKLYDLYSVYRV